jgi:hypothetical protein
LDFRRLPTTCEDSPSGLLIEERSIVCVVAATSLSAAARVAIPMASCAWCEAHSTCSLTTSIRTLAVFPARELGV